MKIETLPETSKRACDNCHNFEKAYRKQGIQNKMLARVLIDGDGWCERCLEMYLYDCAEQVQDRCRDYCPHHIVRGNEVPRSFVSKRNMQSFEYNALSMVPPNEWPMTLTYAFLFSFPSCFLPFGIMCPSV